MSKVVLRVIINKIQKSDWKVCGVENTCKAYFSLLVSWSESTIRACTNMKRRWFFAGGSVEGTIEGPDFRGAFHGGGRGWEGWDVAGRLQRTSDGKMQKFSIYNWIEETTTTTTYFVRDGFSFLWKALLCYGMLFSALLCFCYVT